MNVFIVFLGLLPSFIWLSFFLQEDIHPEPRKMVFLAFIAGIVAAFFAIALQYPLSNYFKDQGLGITAYLPITVFAGIEEIMKFIFAYMAVGRSKYLDEPADAMIYMVATASGMAAFENVALMMSSEAISQKTEVLVLRFLGATLLHILSSSIVGYYWAKGMLRRRVVLNVLAGLILAVLMHASFNLLIAVSRGGVVYSVLFLVVAAFFIFYDFEKLKETGQKLEV